LQKTTEHNLLHAPHVRNKVTSLAEATAGSPDVLLAGHGRVTSCQQRAAASSRTVKVKISGIAPGRFTSTASPSHVLQG
jgi:hypothetical protein